MGVGGVREMKGRATRRSTPRRYRRVEQGAVMGKGEEEEVGGDGPVRVEGQGVEEEAGVGVGAGRVEGAGAVGQGAVGVARLRLRICLRA